MSYKIKDFASPSDYRVIALRMRFGWPGYGIYFAIVSLLETQPDTALDADYQRLGLHLKAEEETIKAVVEDFGLFRLETVEGHRRFYIPRLREEEQARRKHERDEHKTISRASPLSESCIPAFSLPCSPHNSRLSNRECGNPAGNAPRNHESESGRMHHRGSCCI